jgi:hypothetical protein
MNLANLFTEARKTVINVATAVGAAAPWILNVMHEPPFQGTQTAATVSAILTVFGIILHYLVPNTTTNPDVAAAQSVKLVAAPRGRAV